MKKAILFSKISLLTAALALMVTGMLAPVSDAGPVAEGTKYRCHGQTETCTFTLADGTVITLSGNTAEIDPASN